MRYLGQQVRQVVLGWDVGGERFSHGDGLLYRMLAYRIVLLLLTRLRSMGVIDNRHVVSINEQGPEIGTPIILNL